MNCETVPPPMPESGLVDALAAAAEQWTKAHADEAGCAAPLSRLAKLAVGNPKFFDELPDMRRGPTTSMLERFARFLHDSTDWPDGLVPVEVCRFAHRVGVSAEQGGSSAGKVGEVSSGVAA